jgi:formate/nitrite transporter
LTTVCALFFSAVQYVSFSKQKTHQIADCRNIVQLPTAKSEIGELHSYHLSHRMSRQSTRRRHARSSLELKQQTNSSSSPSALGAAAQPAALTGAAQVTTDTRKPGERKQHHMKFYKTPKETIAAIGVAGFNKGQMSLLKTLLQAILAGILLSFGGLLALIAGGGLAGVGAANPGLQKFAAGALFPIGLMLIVLTGAELFTGNTMYMPTALLTKQTHWTKLASNWALVYLGNFAGSLLFAYFLAYLTELLAAEPFLTFAVGLAEKKVHLGWGVALLRGIGCNWLVTLALWSAMVAEDTMGKWVGVWFPVMTFVMIGFEHSVANMFFIPVGMMYGANITVGEFLWYNLVPVTLGNIITGTLFVATAYWFVFLTPAAPPDDEMLERQAVNRKFKLFL